MKRTLGALIFPEFELLDLFGPLEMFGLLEHDYDITLVAETTGPVVSNQQVRAMADVDIAAASKFDMILVPGGRGTRREVENPLILEWIENHSATADLTMSVCTGSALLARAGVLDGRKATTNKAAFAWVTTQGPQVNWQTKARWVEDGSFFTSSGVSAGMDMALAVIGHHHGDAKADQVAHWSEYRRVTDANDDPFAAAHGLD